VSYIVGKVLARGKKFCEPEVAAMLQSKMAAILVFPYKIMADW